MELTDFQIEYKGIQISNILRVSWLDMPNGFNRADGLQDFTIMVKVVYVDECGRLLCIEDLADNFRFRPKAIDITE